MKTIAICNQKGGVGKTSTAVTLASFLAIHNFKTLIVDLDPQGNATSGIGIDKSQLTLSVYNALLDVSRTREFICTTDYANLWILPSNIDLTGAEVELVPEMGREHRLKKALAGINSEFEFVIIDCAPSLGLLTINALSAADTVLIPIQCEFYALEGLTQLMNTISLVRDNINDKLSIEGILMTMADNRTRLSEQVVNEVKNHYSKIIYNSVIPRSIKMSEAPGFGKPIMFYDKNCAANKSYEDFFKEFIIRQPNQLLYNKIQQINNENYNNNDTQNNDRIEHVEVIEDNIAITKKTN